MTTASSFLGLIGSIGFGTSDFLVKLLSKKNSPIALLFWPQLLGGIFLLPFVFIGGVPTNLTRTVILALLLSLLDFVTTLLLYTALAKGRASVISPIFSSFMAVSVIFSFLVFGESLSPTQLAVTLLIFVGVILLSLEFDQSQKANKPRLLSGVPEAVLATIAIGIYIPTWGKFVQNNNWLATITIVRLTIPLIIFLTRLVQLRKPFFPPPIAIRSLFVISTVNTVAQVGSTIAFNIAPQVNLVSIILATSPLVTILLSSLFLSERLNKYQKIGVALTSLGTIYLSSR